MAVQEQADIKLKSVGKKRKKIFRRVCKRGKIQCNFCELTTWKHKLHSHVSKFHNKSVRCQVNKCVNYFNTEKKQHQAQVHKEWKKCIYCSKIYAMRANLMSHIQNNHKGAIRCDFHTICGKFFHTTAEKDEHILHVHKANKGRMRCVYCCKMYTNKIFLRVHIKRVHAAVVIKCKFNRCGQYFLSKAESDEHFQKVHHHVDSLKQFECPKCGFNTTEKYLLLSHLYRNHRDDEVKCHECHAVFWSRMNLKRHLPCLLNRKVSCEHCGQEMFKLSLFSHLKRHYLCKVCNLELSCVNEVKLHATSCPKT